MVDQDERRLSVKDHQALHSRRRPDRRAPQSGDERAEPLIGPLLHLESPQALAGSPAGVLNAPDYCDRFE
jgi:hypothetical protein